MHVKSSESITMRTYIAFLCGRNKYLAKHGKQFYKPGRSQGIQFGKYIV